MYINNGHTLFGNVGLIISILILFVLLYFSYNKCYNKSSFIEEPFYDEPIVSTPNLQNMPPPKDVRIIITGGVLTLNFSIDNSPQNILPQSFIVVLAQYDSNKNNTGNNKFYISKETILNPNIKYGGTTNPTYPSNTQSSLQASASLLVNSQTNLCALNSGIPVCQYTYNDIDIRDPNGNIYYYKLGIAAMYSNVNSAYITPYNVNSQDKLFTLESSTEQQNKQYANFLEYQKAQNQLAMKSSSSYDNTMSTADGQYELIKSQLGNYPDNLLIDSQKVNKGTLSDLVDKSMSQAVINVNVV